MVPNDEGRLGEQGRWQQLCRTVSALIARSWFSSPGQGGCPVAGGGAPGERTNDDCYRISPARLGNDAGPLGNDAGSGQRRRPMGSPGGRWAERRRPAALMMGFAAVMDGGFCWEGSEMSRAPTPPAVDWSPD